MKNNNSESNEVKVYQSAAQMPKEPSVRKLLGAQGCMDKYTRYSTLLFTLEN